MIRFKQMSIQLVVCNEVHSARVGSVQKLDSNGFVAVVLGAVRPPTCRSSQTTQ